MQEKGKLLGDDDQAAAMAMTASSPAPEPSFPAFLLRLAQAYAGCLLQVCGTSCDAAAGGADGRAAVDRGGETPEDLQIDNRLVHARRPEPPGDPREGSGGDRGSHN